MTSTRCSCMWRFAIVALGIISISAGVYLYLNWIEIFTRLRGKEMALSPTAPSYAGWKVSPLPLNFDIYLFNWTNPADYYVGSNNKPRFEQLGPYRFRESPDKVDIHWHTHNSSVSFRKKAYFHFDAENSKGSLSDRVTSVNTVAHSAVLRAKDANSFQKRMLQGGLNIYNEGLTTTKTAEEWMFKGYKDPLVTLGSFISIFAKDIEVPYDRIGWLYPRNGSDDYEGHLTMFTGADDINKMGQLYAWNDKTHTGVYPGQCGEIKGSMGEFFPSNLTPNDSIALFVPNMCRSVPLDYAGTHKIHGITAYKFSGSKRAMDNGTLHPENKCYCVNDQCVPAGLINVGPCKYNSSIYMSFPHFYLADPSYLEAVEGLSPDKEKHEFFMTLEPNAGVVMDAGGGFQANYLLQPVAGFDAFANIPRTFIPLMWAEERVRVTPEIAKEIAIVPFVILLGQLFTSVLLAAGFILICWYPTKYVTQICDDPKTKTTLLNPLSNSTRSVSLTAARKLNGLRPSEGVSLLEYKNGCGGGVIIQPNGSVTAGLLGNTVRTRDDVISR